MNFSEIANKIFVEVIEKYHLINTVDQLFENAYDKNTHLLEHLLYRKCWIDTVQWHYEDIIRDPNIDPVAALKLKRQIDASNQDRTDMVEFIDSYFLEEFKSIIPSNDAKINSESPAWAIDRLSILALIWVIMGGLALFIILLMEFISLTVASWKYKELSVFVQG